jgi:hypothetical protein
MSFSSQKFQGEVSFIDAGNNVSRMVLEIRTATLAGAAGIMAAAIADIVALTQAYVQNYSVRQVFSNDDARPSPAVGEVEEKLVLSIALDTPGKKGTIVVPAPVNSIFGAPGTSGYNVADVADALITALTDKYQVTGGSFYLSDGESASDTNTVLAGRRTHRSSSNG